ncbi:MAG: DinB family protein [Bacteroidota bacterium]|nr:DinB family protein [Bacteroidota bacterium]
MKSPDIISAIVRQLEESYHQQSWHGTNLRGSIRGVPLTQALWRPSPNRHNIWEVVVHCAYWKYTVRRRLTGEKRGSFPLKGSNWFKRSPDGTEEQWKKDVRLLEEMHYLLVEEVKKLSAFDLIKHTAGSKFTNLQTITGIAMHDVYHAGQIQLLKRLQK